MFSVLTMRLVGGILLVACSLALLSSPTEVWAGWDQRSGSLPGTVDITPYVIVAAAVTVVAVIVLVSHKKKKAKEKDELQQPDHEEDANTAPRGDDSGMFQSSCSQTAGPRSAHSAGTDGHQKILSGHRIEPVAILERDGFRMGLEVRF